HHVEALRPEDALELPERARTDGDAIVGDARDVEPMDAHAVEARRAGDAGEDVDLVSAAGELDGEVADLVLDAAHHRKVPIRDQRDLVSHFHPWTASLGRVPDEAGRTIRFLRDRGGGKSSLSRLRLVAAPP